MSTWDAIIMGIVEGLTEYLPVSSTGHLIITQYLLGLPATKAVKAFEVCIQSGAILAVLSIYFGRVSSVFKGLAGKSPEGLRLLVNLLFGFLPAAVLGLALHKWIKTYLFTAETVAATWALGGLAILFYVRFRSKKQQGNGGRPLEAMTWKDALAIGLLQCIAMCPGTSRSLMTMLGGMFVGLSVSAAVEFSFLLGLVTLGAATVFDAWDAGADMVNELGAAALVMGTVVSWASAWAAVKWMVGYLQRHSLALFGWYRLAAAIVLAFLIARGLSVEREETPDLRENPAAVSVEKF
ncbi:MAG: undecaprenyl-diphosphate phosphatase [Akkermansiaceae bacterium]|nr:undecaprenyl-diphosphate phosphatase [Akkermansiaceae bacterium]